MGLFFWTTKPAKVLMFYSGADTNSKSVEKKGRRQSQIADPAEGA